MRSPPQRLPTSLLLLYALPALPLAALTLPLYIVLPTYYSEVANLPLTVVGSTLLAVRIFDALCDPVIGWLSDRWHPSFGRRRALFACSLPLTAFATVMLFWPPRDAGTFYLLGWGIAVSIGYTASLLPFSAWGAELAGGYGERSRVAAFREGFTLAGTLVAIALPFSIGLTPSGGIGGLAVLGLAVAGGLIVLGGTTVAAVPEPRNHSIAKIRFRDGLRHMAANRPFMRLLTAFLLNGLANGIPATLFLYYVSDRLGATDMRGPLLFLYFLAGVAGTPLAVRLSHRWGKHRAWSTAMLGVCAVFAMVPFIPQGAVGGFACVSVLTGLALGFDLALPSAIQADVIDVDTEASGEQRSGFYFAAWSLATKLALALAVGIAFPLIGFFGFDVDAGEANSESALFALAAIYAWLPVVFKLAAVALMWNFPLDETKQRDLRARIEKRKD